MRRVGSALEEINFKPLGSLEGSIQDDVNFLRNHPLILPGTRLTGWHYNWNNPTRVHISSILLSTY